MARPDCTRHAPCRRCGYCTQALARMAYRIAHKRRGSCFANMHTVAEALGASGFSAVDPLADRPSGWFAARYREAPGAMAVLFTIRGALAGELGLRILRRAQEYMAPSPSNATHCERGHR